jgi:hypothetical protein
VEPLFDDKRFMAEVSKVLRQRGLSTDATRLHRENASALAREHSADVFVAALDSWTLHHQQKDASSLHQRTWVLEHFVSSGAALDYIQQVKQPSGVGQAGREGSNAVCTTAVASSTGRELMEKLTARIYNYSKKSFTAKQKAELQPVLDKYGVDLVYEAWEDFFDACTDDFERKFAAKKFVEGGALDAVKKVDKDKKKAEWVEKTLAAMEIRMAEEAERENAEILRKREEESAESDIEELLGPAQWSTGQ